MLSLFQGICNYIAISIIVEETVLDPTHSVNSFTRSYREGAGSSNRVYNF